MVVGSVIVQFLVFFENFFLLPSVFRFFNGFVRNYLTYVVSHSSAFRSFRKRQFIEKLASI